MEIFKGRIRPFYEDSELERLEFGAVEREAKV